MFWYRQENKGLCLYFVIDMTCFKLFHCANQLHLLLLKLQGVTDMVFRISDITGADLDAKTVVFILCSFICRKWLFSSVSSVKSCPCVFQDRGKVCLFICLPFHQRWLCVFLYLSCPIWNIITWRDKNITSCWAWKHFQHFISESLQCLSLHLYFLQQLPKKHKTGNGTFMQILNEIPPRLVFQEKFFKV